MKIGIVAAKIKHFFKCNFYISLLELRSKYNHVMRNI